MSRMKLKVLSFLAATLFAGSFALAANIPLISTPVEPANTVATIDGVIQQINGGVTGNLASLPAAVVTTDTNADTLFRMTIPAGQMSAPGTTLHVQAYGVNSADANAKTITFNFGASSCAVIVTGSGNTWLADLYVTLTGSKTQTSECHGLTNVTPVVSTQATNWAIDNTANIAVTVTGTAATSGTTTANMVRAEMLR